jgi:hypothetical protein
VNQWDSPVSRHDPRQIRRRPDYRSSTRLSDAPRPVKHFKHRMSACTGFEFRNMQ